MHAYAIQHAISQGRTVYDFLSGATRYKKQLSDDENPLVQIRAMPKLSVPAAMRRQATRAEDLARQLRQRMRDRGAASGSGDGSE